MILPNNPEPLDFNKPKSDQNLERRNTIDAQTPSNEQIQSTEIKNSCRKCNENNE